MAGAWHVAGVTGGDKATVRRELLAQRAAQSSEEIDRRSGALAGHIVGDARWRSAGRVAAFVGVRGEPEMGEVLRAARAEGRELWLPRVVRGEPMLTFVQVDDLDRLAPAAFGLLEPAPMAGERTCKTLEAMDLVLVPGVGFTRAGERIGFGRGYYDRALSTCGDAPPPHRVGICFAPFVRPAGSIPTDVHDIRMHGLLTDEGPLTPSGA